MGRTTELRRTAVYVVTAVMAGFGLTGAASAQSLSNTNGGWSGKTSTTTLNKCSVTNTNNVSVTNRNNQSAVSGSAIVMGNSSGFSWGGWDALSPLDAQAQGNSYGSWYNSVVNWISNRANGAGWVSTGNGVPMSGGNSWNNFDPMAWQANGMKFADWYNAVEQYLNQNSPAWLLGWPSTDNNGGAISANTGNATNNNSANFSININNAASAQYGAPTCEHSYPTSHSSSCACSSSGVIASNANSLMKQPHESAPPSYAPSSTPQSMEGYGVPGYSPGYTPTEQQAAPNSYAASANQTPSNAYCPPTSSSPSSSQTVPTTATYKATVTNTNVVSVSNVNTQTAVTGNAIVANNGPSGMSGSGDAANGNGTGMSAGLEN
jgi:hypothetical protein